VVAARTAWGFDYHSAWFAHHRRLVDGFVVLHRAEDGEGFRLLSDLAAGHPDFVLLTHGYRMLGDTCSMTALVQYAVSAGADWVIPLDQDEFLTHPDRGALEASLSGAVLVRSPWRNLAPSSLRDGRPFRLSQEFLALRNSLRIPKVFVSAELVRRHPDLWVRLGNHGVMTGHDGVELVPDPDVGALDHLPILSVGHLEQKLGLTIPWLSKPSARAAKRGGGAIFGLWRTS